jgi:carbonic anhydrase
MHSTTVSHRFAISASRLFAALALGSIAGGCSRAAAGAARAAAGDAQAAAPAKPAADRSPLELLMEGNARFVAGRTVHPNQSAERRTEEAKTQHPFAVIVSCSDSRVSPEIVFDQGIGDLFVVRTAGNRLDDLVLASVEYAVDHLHVPLVVVLGHERCGAVSAAIEAENAAGGEHGHDASGSHIPQLVKALHDAVVDAKSTSGDPIENTVLANIRIVARDLPVQSPMLGERVKAGTLKVLGMRYDLDTGAITPVDAPPAAPH